MRSNQKKNGLYLWPEIPVRNASKARKNTFSNNDEKDEVSKDEIRFNNRIRFQVGKKKDDLGEVVGGILLSS